MAVEAIERSRETRPVAAAVPTDSAAEGLLGGRLGRRRSALTEVAAFVVFYALYEILRGVVAGDAVTAVGHGRQVADLERAAHVFVEPAIAHDAGFVPGLTGVLAVSYVTLHFVVTTAALVWLHRRRPVLYPLVRTTLLVASGLALIGYLTYPTAPPRLAHLSIPDAVSTRSISLNHGLVSALYNPYAAVPSLHTAYALVIGSAVAAAARRPAVRILGAAYPAFVVFMIVATGNHFLVDAAAGGAVAIVSYGIAAGLLGRPSARVSAMSDARCSVLVRAAC
jgi:PAP2 superfamily